MLLRYELYPIYKGEIMGSNFDRRKICPAERRLKIKAAHNTPKLRRHHMKLGCKNYLNLLKCSDFKWDNVPFSSKQEMEIAQRLLNKPIMGVNCHIRIGSKIIDFFPQENDKELVGHFVEYHPYDSRLTPMQYYKKRTQTINHSRFKGTPLIIVTSHAALSNIIRKL